MSGTGTVGGDLRRRGEVSPGDGAGPGILNAQGDVDFAGDVDDEQGQGSTLTVAPERPDTGHRLQPAQCRAARLIWTGCDLNASLGFTPANGEQFTIIKSTAPIVGTFHGLPEGASLTIGNTAIHDQLSTAGTATMWC